MRAPARTVSWAARAAGVLAAALLVALGVTYYFSYEPAFEVTIVWGEEVTWNQRVDLERRFGLERRRNQARRARTYDLVDTRAENIRELIERPEVEDAGILDRRTFTVPADAPYGLGWMWAADRWPIARRQRLLPLVIGGCVLVMAYALASEVRARRKDVLRLLSFHLGRRRRRVEHPGERLTDGDRVGP